MKTPGMAGHRTGRIADKEDAMSTTSIVTQKQNTTKTPMLEKLLFETRAGERLLTWLEAHGLAIVRADWLGEQRG
jgi:hypothetical protein